MQGQMSVMIHGGAGRAPANADVESYEVQILKEALDAAWKSLLQSATGEVAVAAALQVLERDGYFDAGYGSYPNENGLVRCDVALMRGSGDFISLMNMRRIRYPSQVALDLLEKRKNLMAVWTDEMMQTIDHESDTIKQRYGWVATEEQMVAPIALEKVQARKQREKVPLGHDTVGCVVRDSHGKLFAGTSTGGIMLKPDGRVGDSPILGAGVFADDGIAALSATGQGEMILKSLLSSFVIADVRSFVRAEARRFEQEPELLKKILRSELNEMRRKYPGSEAGLIVMPAFGEPAYDFTAEALPLAYRSRASTGAVAEEVSIVRGAAAA